MANMKDFLTMYYNRLIFSEMSYEQFVQFCGYINDKKATDNQKIWAEELLKKDPVTGEFEKRTNTDIYVQKKLPNPDDPTEGLDEKEWKKLFKSFQTAFQAMDSARKDFKYNEKATEFLDKYFGSHTSGALTVHHLFQYSKANATGKQKIGPAPAGTSTVTLHSFLVKYKNRLELQLKNWGVLTDDFSYDDLLNGITSEKYNTNPKFRKNMERVAQVIDGYIAGDATMQARLGITNTSEIPDCSDTSTWFDDDNISSFRLEQFKNEYTTLLNTLRSESKIREVFENYDDGKISGPLNKALQNQSYDDPNSDDYVQPKREETLTMPERLAQWWSDTYSDCLEKYATLRGDRLFFSTEAKNICKYLQKDLKKTDGLDGVLKKIGDAKSNLAKVREFKSKKHLEWFEKTLNALKNDPKLSKVWDGALSDGTHMQALVKEIIIRAIKEGKKDEAKTALELISVLHYDYTTSKIMDALKKENLSVFSDSKLSWNKHEGVQLVTNALDKSIKWALMGIGYGLTMAGNAYKLAGRKIKKYSDNKGEGNFKEEHDKYLEQQQDKKQALVDQLTNERQLRTDTQTTVDGIRGTRTYDRAKSDLEAEIGIWTGRANTAQARFTTQQNAISNALVDPATGNLTVPVDDYNNIIAFINNLIDTNDVAGLPAFPTGITTTLGVNISYELQLLRNYKRILLMRTGARDQRQQSLDDLVNGTELLNQLNEQITRHDEEVRDWDANHMDEMEELVQHWNMLETGRNTKTGPMYNWLRNLSKKKAQERLNNQLSSIISQYNSSHSIAA